MASITKITITRWIDPKTNARVPAGTLGAKKIKDKTECYYIVDKSSGKTQRINTNCTDYRAAQTALSNYHRAQERGEQGMTDPFKQHLDRAITEHLAEYMEAVRGRVRSESYPATAERELKRLFTACGITQLRHLTAERVQSYLSKLKVKAVTQNRLRSYVRTFCDWLRKRGRLATNPIELVDTAKAKPGEAEKRKRRALRPSELRLLLQAAEQYPLAVASTNTGGRKRSDGTKRPPSVAKLSDQTRLELQQQGRERRLLYRVALLTGLRRGELSRVRVRHFTAKTKLIELPGALTKNGRPAVIPIPPTLATDLSDWIAAAGTARDSRLFVVPESRNLIKQHRARLKFAGIAYSTDSGFADFHSLRKTVNTFLRKKGVPLRLRQRFLRHAAADLATSTYDDERGAELKPVLKWLGKLDRYLQREPPADTGSKQ